MVYVNNIMKTIGSISQELLFNINKTHLLIVVMLCVCSGNLIKGQQKSDYFYYDSLTQKEVYVVVEKMPVYKGGDPAFQTRSRKENISAFLADFSKRFTLDESADTEPLQTKLKVQFVIDNEGHLIGARIPYKKEKDKLSAFERSGLKTINSMQDWQPGIHEGKAVNVILTTVIHIDRQY